VQDLDKACIGSAQAQVLMALMILLTARKIPQRDRAQ
jgi:hypothetical protein